MKDNLLIVACSAERSVDEEHTELIPAIEFYDGGVIRPLRERLYSASTSRVHLSSLLSNVYFLSAKYGLVHATENVLWYEQPLDEQRATELRPEVMHQLEQLVFQNLYEEIFFVIEPFYMQLFTSDLSNLPGSPRLGFLFDHANGWAQLNRVLSEWGWWTNGV